MGLKQALTALAALVIGLVAGYLIAGLGVDNTPSAESAAITQSVTTAAATTPSNSSLASTSTTTSQPATTTTPPPTTTTTLVPTTTEPVAGFENPGDKLGPFEIISLRNEFEEPVGVAVVWYSVDERHAARFVCPAPAPSYLNVEAFVTQEYVAANNRTDRVALSVKFDQDDPFQAGGSEHPGNRAILLSSTAIPMTEANFKDQMYVVVTNYDDDTFLMKFEAEGHWPTVSEYLWAC